MSYTPPPTGYLTPVQPNAQPPRPSTVTISSFLLIAMAVLQLLGIGLALLSLGAGKDAVAKLYSSGSEEAKIFETAFTVGIVIAVVMSVIFAALLLVCGIFVGKGKQWARITTWVVGGLLVCCGIGGLAGNALQGMMPQPPSGSGPSQAEITQAVQDATPGWITGVTTGVQLIGVLAALAVVILLALPPSHAFFRKPAPEWTPPTYPTV
jgi:hypothetical protein